MCDVAFRMLLDLCLNTDFSNKNTSRYLDQKVTSLPFKLPLKLKGAFLIL